MSLIIINSTCKLNKMQIRIYMTWSQKKALLANFHLLQTQILVDKITSWMKKKSFIPYYISYHINSYIIYLVQGFFFQVIARFISILYLTVGELA